MSDFEEFENDLGLDEQDRKAAKSDTDVEWYKGVKGRTDKAAIIYFHTVDVSAKRHAIKRAVATKSPHPTPVELEEIGKKALEVRAANLKKALDEMTEVEKLDLSEVQFKRLQHHFGGEGVGDVISRLGKDGPEADKVWSQLEEPKIHFTTLLLLYPTDKNGELDKNRFASWASDPTIVPWKFSQKRYDLIWKVNSGLKKNSATIADQDLLLECKDDKYQQIEPSADGKATWLRSEKIKLNVLTKAVRLYPKLVPYRAITTAQLREKLGLDEAGNSGTHGAVADVSSADFQEFINQV